MRKACLFLANTLLSLVSQCEIDTVTWYTTLFDIILNVACSFWQSSEAKAAELGDIPLKKASIAPKPIPVLTRTGQRDILLFF